MVQYNIKVCDEKGKIPETCPWCGMRKLERLQDGQWACTLCKKLFFVTEMSDQEMLEWFVDRERMEIKEIHKAIVNMRSSNQTNYEKHVKLRIIMELARQLIEEQKVEGD